MTNERDALIANLKRLVDPATTDDSIDTRDAVKWIDEACAALDTPDPQPALTEQERNDIQIAAWDEGAHDMLTKIIAQVPAGTTVDRDRLVNMLARFEAEAMVPVALTPAPRTTEIEARP